ncbi:ABC transporter permease [Anaerovibrio sp.]|uniref:ABC transporter permease n=1 Tax=Anaerovibrio sp. TaxID=1872532 RepID=UPI00388E3541
MVSLVITVIFSVMLGLNYAKDTPIMVIDLDNSHYSREIINDLNNSQLIAVKAVINTPVEPNELMYRDKAYAVVYFPQGMEKNHYNGEAVDIGVFYDNTSSSALSGVREALNEIVADVNNPSLGTGDTIQGGTKLVSRSLFNPSDSASNGEVIGFLIFFSSMFFAFATLGMVPRLRQEGKMALHLKLGTAYDLLQRLLPYCGCWLIANFIGLVVLRFWGDINFSGSILLYFFVQAIYIITLGMISLIMGWGAANPGAASSRMILFVPGGFIFGGYGVPMTLMPEWVHWFNQIFPLTWEFKFIRDVVFRGAGFFDCATTIGQFMIYIAIVWIIFARKFDKEQIAQNN